MNKSDEMVKSLVASTASQAVGIYQQLKREHELEIMQYQAGVRSFNSRVNELKKEREKLLKELEADRNELQKLREDYAVLEKESEQHRRWWLKATEDRNAAQKELKDLKDQHASESDDLEEEVKEALA